MLYGTDHPFGRYDAILEQLNFSPSERDLIYRGNAERLLNLKQVSAGVRRREESGR